MLSPWFILTPLIGDTGVGALTLSVDPSAAALPVRGAAALGEVGAADCLLHAAASAITHTLHTLEANWYFRLIYRSLPHTLLNTHCFFMGQREDDTRQTP
jgi:hypothetical protein